MTRLVLVPALLLVTASFGGGCHITLGGVNGVHLEKDAQRQETRALELDAGDTLTLDTNYGDIQVATGERPELRATLHASGRTQEEAETVLARYQLTLERGPKGPVARLAGEPLRIHEGSLTLELSAHVDFDVTVAGGTALVARSESGDIRARGALGSCTLATSYGEVALEGVRGDVHAHSSSGNVSARDVECAELTLETDYGAVAASRAKAEHIRCKSSSGDVSLDAASASSSELATDYGAVHAREVSGDLSAHSSSGDVRLHGVQGAIHAKSDYGAVEVDGVLAALSARTSSGDVAVRARAGSRNDAGWTLASDYGQVVLHVPDGFGCRLDAHTSYGEVESDFSVASEAGKKKKDHALQGTVGAGGGTVTLHSGSGDVALKKL